MRKTDAASVYRVLTPLEDSFSCNFNVLVAGVPRGIGCGETARGMGRVPGGMCPPRRTHFDLTKKKDKLHLLRGLQAILLDIDKAVSIVRETDEETAVVPNLMAGFGIDEVQAEYVAEIKLRHLNREYILKRTDEITSLEKDIEDLQSILDSRDQGEKYYHCRTAKSHETIWPAKEKYADLRRGCGGGFSEEIIPDYPVHLFFSREGYFKKITPQSLRMSGEQKLKEGDAVSQQMEATNSCDLLFFTDRATVYKAKASDFPDTKASVIGEMSAAKLGMEEGENAIYMAATKGYEGHMLFSLKTAKWLGWIWNPTPRKPIAGGWLVHTAIKSQLRRFAMCRSRRRC